MFLKNTFITVVVFILAILLIQLPSCRQDDIDTTPGLSLEFSVDSLLFDTVFTTVGSSTRFFKVYNPHNARLSISSIELGAGMSSYFRINADGRSGTHVRNVEIEPRDSLFVFVEVTVDPVGEDLPLIISDSVVFHTNNNIQDVKLVAWGQDAHFIRPNFIDTINDLEYHVLAENTVWSGSKPYVIYGAMFVAPDITLRIEEGVNVHLHHQSAMIFTSRSSLNIEGTLEEPVVIQGDRLEQSYRDIPGQWGYIYLTATSKNHHINHAVIKNGTYGIVMDSIGSFTEPSLRINNTIIKNKDQTGLELNGAWVEASNLVVGNCGLHSISMRFGGRYDFRHVTVGNYFSLPGVIRQTPAVFINDYFIDTTGTVQVRPIEHAFFGNSIIYGSLQDEIGFDMQHEDPGQSNISFDHNLIRTSLHNTYPGLFTNSLFNEQPRFYDTPNSDYRLREDSPVRGEGSTEIAAQLPMDILGNNRQDTIDLGAYQYYEIIDEDEDNGNENNGNEGD